MHDTYHNHYSILNDEKNIKRKASGCIVYAHTGYFIKNTWQKNNDFQCIHL